MPRLVLHVAGGYENVKVLVDDNRTFAPTQYGWSYRILNNYKFDIIDMDLKFIEERDPQGFHRILVASNPYGGNIRLHSDGTVSSEPVVAFRLNQGMISAVVIDDLGVPIATELLQLIDYNPNFLAKISAFRELEIHEKSTIMPHWLNTQAMDHYVRGFYLQQTQMQYAAISSLASLEYDWKKFREYVEKDTLKNIQPPYNNQAIARGFSRKTIAKKHAPNLLKKLKEVCEVRMILTNPDRKKEPAKKTEVLLFSKEPAHGSKEPKPAPEIHLDIDREFEISFARAAIESLAAKYKYFVEESQIQELLTDLAEIFKGKPNLQKQNFSFEFQDLFHKCPLDVFVCLQGIYNTHNSKAIPVELRAQILKALLNVLLLQFTADHILKNTPALQYLQRYKLDDLIFENCPSDLQHFSTVMLNKIAETLTAVEIKPEKTATNIEKKASNQAPLPLSRKSDSTKQKKHKTKKGKDNTAEEDDIDDIIAAVGVIAPAVATIVPIEHPIIAALKNPKTNANKLKEIIALHRDDLGVKSNNGNTVMHTWIERNDPESSIGLALFKVLYPEFMNYLSNVKFSSQLSNIGSLQYTGIVEFLRNKNQESFLTILIEKCKSVASLQTYMSLIIPQNDPDFLTKAVTPLIITKNSAGKNAYIMLYESARRFSKSDYSLGAKESYAATLSSMVTFCNLLLSKIGNEVEIGALSSDIVNFCNFEPENSTSFLTKIFEKEQAEKSLEAILTLYLEISKISGKDAHDKVIEPLIYIETNEENIKVLWPATKFISETLLKTYQTNRNKFNNLTKVWMQSNFNLFLMSNTAMFLCEYLSTETTWDMLKVEDTFRILRIVFDNININNVEKSLFDSPVLDEIVDNIYFTILILNIYAGMDIAETWLIQLYDLAIGVLESSIKIAIFECNLNKPDNMLHLIFATINKFRAFSEMNTTLLRALKETIESSKPGQQAFESLMNQANTANKLPLDLIKSQEVLESVLQALQISPESTRPTSRMKDEADEEDLHGIKNNFASLTMGLM